MNSRARFVRLLHSCRPILRTKKPADKPYREELANITPLSQWGKAPLQEGCSEWYYNRNPRSLELLGAAEKPKGFHRQRKRVGRIDYYHKWACLYTDTHTRQGGNALYPYPYPFSSLYLQIFVFRSSAGVVVPFFIIEHLSIEYSVVPLGPVFLIF